MNIDMERIQGLHSRLLDLSRRSTEVIANAQKQRHPFDNLNDAQRLFCGFLAHEAGQLVIAAATKLGLNQSLHANADIQAAAQSFSPLPDLSSVPIPNWSKPPTSTVRRFWSTRLRR